MKPLPFEPKPCTVRICRIHKKREGSNLCQYCNLIITDDKTVDVTTDWEAGKCTQSEKLNAYGTLRFEYWPTISTAKYVQFMHTTIYDDIIKFLDENWELEMPNLILSVTGGKKWFNLPTDLRKAFKIGLLKVASSTSTWITTTGIHTGVTRLVGEAVSESTIKSNLILMGITNWCNVGGRESLENNHYRIVPYSTLLNLDYYNRLNPNHSHFIFFEDNLMSPEQAIIYKSNLEYSIKVKSNAVMMLIVVQGGLTAFQTVENALKNGVTVLCLQKSGGCADILIKTCSKSQKWTDEMLQDLVFKEFSKHKEAILKLLKSILELWEKNVSLVSVFSVESEEDTELGILRGFINARKEKVYENFELALTWNQYEIARTSILSQDMEIDQLDDLFELALIYDRYEFAEILLENGVQLEEFLTDDRWQKLFNLEHKIKMTDCVIWRILAKRKIHCGVIDENILKKVVQLLTFRDLEIEFLKSSMYAAQNLFLWALLYNRTNVAKLLWRKGKYQIMNGLFASKLLDSMKEFFPDKTEHLTKEAEKFEDLAIDILTTIGKESHPIVNNCLLLRKVPIYNDNCLQMALKCECKRFVLHPNIQVLLNDIWNWNITLKRTYRSLFMKIVVFVLSIVSFGFLTPFFMEITKNRLEGIEQNPISDQYLKCSKFVDSNKIIMDAVIHQSKAKEAQSKLENKKLLFNYTIEFFRRPKTIFIYDVFLHLTFVTLFSYMMLCEFHYYKVEGDSVMLFANYHDHQAISIVVDLWILAICIEEFREFIAPMKSYNLYINDVKRQNFISYFKYCFKQYMHDEWNVTDFFGCLIFFVGEGIRIYVTYSCDDTNYLDYENRYKAARIILSIDLLIWYCRILFFYLGSDIWGPKLEIIKNLMKDLFFFVLIIGVVSCAFGVVTEATMFPQYSFSTDTIKGMIRNAFWVIFGEFRMYDRILDAETCKANGEKCPDDVGLAFSFALLIIYPFFILMFVNLLIAMFNFTIERIHNESQVIWRYQRYYMIVDYCKYPFMVAPFSLVGDTIIFMYDGAYWIYRKVFGHEDDKLSNQINQESENKLVLYEYRYTNEVYQKKEKIEKQALLIKKRNDEQGSRIRSLETQLNRIYEEIKSSKSLKQD